MRLPILLASVAACGGPSDGALLEVRAPAGPATAGHVELVLASADATTIADVVGQRVMPTMTTGEQARYYRQRATAGEVDAIAKLDGFVVRIEPNHDASPDDAFIPFLLAYDDSAGAQTLVGIGAVLDGAGDPMAVAIQAGQTAQYFVDMVPLATTKGESGIASGESLTVTCGTNNQPFRSGIAWRPGSGPQLRLLLPDTSTDATVTDATARALDLDCDGHTAPDEDCDDLRPAFNNDAAEHCDGQDTNCDGARFELVSCTLPGSSCPATSSGVELCADVGQGQPGQCVGDPQCQCANGFPGPCTKCILDFKATADTAKQEPCAPAIGSLAVLGCTPALPCTVDVIERAGNPWRGEVSALPDQGFGRQATGVADQVFVRAKLVAGNDVPGMAGSSVGAIFLAITAAGTTRYVGVDLELTGAGAGDCQGSGGNAFAMQCSGP